MSRKLTIPFDSVFCFQSATRSYDALRFYEAWVDLYYVVKLVIKDEFSLLCQQCWDDDAIPSHYHICVRSYKGEADIDQIAMMMAHGKI